MSSKYREFRPNKKLEKYIKCFWYLEKDYHDEAPPEADTILPGGCIELIFNLGDLFVARKYDQNEFIATPRFYMCGQMSKATLMKQTGPAKVIGCRFYPWGASPFLKVPVSTVTNRRVEITNLFPHAALKFQEAFAKGAGRDEIIELIQQFLLSRLNSRTFKARFFGEIAEDIISLKSEINVSSIADSAKMSMRQLQRSFREHIGISPAQLFKIVRVQNFIKEKVSNPGVNFTLLAHGTGHYDQAHLIPSGTFCKCFLEF